uniref:Uncharacterized protein n=1 Tax=Rousettus aegyptiacus TaxID=9407 RepID=A0A7J8GC02_ROUAE|nr:hypothetical protein HJG63_011718 [Rousettus aegyptiacus]
MFCKGTRTGSIPNHFWAQINTFPEAPSPALNGPSPVEPPEFNPLGHVPHFRPESENVDRCQPGPHPISMVLFLTLSLEKLGGGHRKHPPPPSENPKVQGCCIPAFPHKAICWSQPGHLRGKRCCE